MENASPDEAHDHGEAHLGRDSSATNAARLDAGLGDFDWAQPPPGSRRTWLTTPSGSLAALTMGDPAGERVVLVPGVTGSKEDFSLMLPILAGSGYHVTSFDMAGQYESRDAGPAVPGARYDHDLFVNDLVAVIEQGGAPAHVLGYSFAGTVSQIALSRRPELFSSLALLSCPPHPGQGFRGIKRIGPITRFATGPLGASLLMWGLRRNVTHVPPGRLRFVTERLEYTVHSSVADVIRLMKNSPNLIDVLADASLPKLIAVGDHDLWPLELHADFAASIGATLTTYPTGHSPCETTPHQLSRDLLALYQQA